MLKEIQARPLQGPLPPRSAQPLKYRPEVDGLRAVAVISVVLFHAGFATFQGGFVGVDVFFVISGYLITSIILSELDRGFFSLRNFYERRARRILPALFFVMLVSIPFAWTWLPPGDMREFSQSLIATSTFLSNVFFWHKSDYFDVAAELKPMLHTWSLAVEEQYYILFPLLLVVLRKWSRQWVWVFGTVAIVLAISLAASEWAVKFHSRAAFFLLPFRAWEIFVGAIAAWYLTSRTTSAVSLSVADVLNAIGLGLIAYAALDYSHATPFPGAHALLPVVGTVLIILFAQQGTIAARVLGFKLLVGIGLISYSLYLVHYPVFVFLRHLGFEDPLSKPFLVSYVVVAALSMFSFHCVERPFRCRGSWSGGRHAMLAGPVAVVLVVSFGILGYTTDGYQDFRYPQIARDNLIAIAKSTNVDVKEQIIDDGDCIFGLKSGDEFPEKRFDGCRAKYGKAVVVLGDSHAINIFNIVAKTKISPFVFGAVRGGCRPQNNTTGCHYDAFNNFINRRKNDVSLVVFHQSGSYFVKDKNGRVDSQLAFQNGAAYSFDRAAIKLTADYVSSLRDVVNTIWIGPFVEMRHRQLALERMARSGEFRLNENAIKIFRELGPVIDDVLRSHRYEFTYLPFIDFVPITGDFLMVDGCLTYRDIDHLSPCGEDLIAPHFGRLREFF